MSNPSISLLPFKPQDFDQLIAWASDAATLMQFAGPAFNFPLTSAQLELSLADKKRSSWSVFYQGDQKVIGHAEIYLQEPGIALLCRILIGEAVYRGKGFGEQVVNKLLEYAFNLPGIEAAELNVFDWNLPAIKCYEKAGFVINPFKTYTRQVNEQLWTALNMRLNRKDYKPI